MQKKLLIAVFALTSVACAKKTEKRNDLDLMRARARQVAMSQLAENFERVHFEFDSHLITPGTRDALAANVEIMNRFPEISVEVEGHCDERGSVEYNLALGERRARSIKKYMVTAGVDRSRITTISYGEEMPLLLGADPSTHGTNRRAEFRMQVTDHPAVRGSVARLDLYQLDLAKN